MARCSQFLVSSEVPSDSAAQPLVRPNAELEWWRVVCGGGLGSGQTGLAVRIWKLFKYGSLIFRSVFRGVSGGDYSLPWLFWCLLGPPDRVLWSEFSCYMNDLSSFWVGANYICIGARSMRLVCLKVMVDFYFRWKADVSIDPKRQDLVSWVLKVESVVERAEGSFDISRLLFFVMWEVVLGFVSYPGVGSSCLFLKLLVLGIS
ncbi:hypothetical protein DY000_02027467 [Brassica cretica]|uniref:Reverse transcriptase zinc-binding domain-containing protein n=1 Tax=Brassica cretica TaxID=69181 RepID=A0ABQ7EIC2_BRACR|nr:hypothetical protein DY000_02027467 [Brassica cretica]